MADRDQQERIGTTCATMPGTMGVTFSRAEQRNSLSCLLTRPGEQCRVTRELGPLLPEQMDVLVQEDATAAAIDKSTDCGKGQ